MVCPIRRELGGRHIFGGRMSGPKRKLPFVNKNNKGGSTVGASKLSQQTIDRVTRLTVDAISEPGGFANATASGQHNELMETIYRQTGATPSRQLFNDIRYVVSRYILKVNGDSSSVTNALTKKVL